MLHCRLGERTKLATERVRLRQVGANLDQFFSPVTESSKKIDLESSCCPDVSHLGTAPVQFVKHCRLERMSTIRPPRSIECRNQALVNGINLARV